MKTNKIFEATMKELSDEVLSINDNKTFNIGSVDTASLLLDIAELHNLRKRIIELEKENESLSIRLEQAHNEISELQNMTKHNARNAGRHKLNTTKKFKQFCKLKKERQSMDYIIHSLGISKRSYYNYLKEYKIMV